MEQWEYSAGSWRDMDKVDINAIGKWLNTNYGEAGWELVSVAVFSTDRPVGSAGMTTDHHAVMIFKRPKPSK